MQVMRYSRVLFSMLACALLLGTLFGIGLLAWDIPASAALTDQPFKMHRVQIQPILFRVNSTLSRQVGPASTAPQPVRFTCQSSINPQPSLCYGPYQMRQAYHVDDLLNQGITGQGSSITIIDAYGSPTIRQDLQRFNEVWGLPDAPLKIIAPYGIQGSDSAWVSETSLDVEWAHVMAPGATINLVLAQDSNDVSIYKVLEYAVKHNLGDIISLSFGENEKCVDPKLRVAEHRVFSEAAKKGMTLLAATGDFGSAQLACDSSAFEKAISFPADDPLVTAVGGTTLIADPVTGQYIREIAWNESSAFNKATGGGYSTIYSMPLFQRDVVGAGTGRAVPDISLNASVNGGVVVMENQRGKNPPTIDIMGGTSAAAPELAGILADGVQMAHHRLGTINPALYRLGTSNVYRLTMHDILSGNNILLSSGLKGYNAGPGWDAATGWGSPRQADAFLRALISAGTVKTPVVPPVPVPAPEPSPALPATPVAGTPTDSRMPATPVATPPVAGTPTDSRTPATPVAGTPTATPPVSAPGGNTPVPLLRQMSPTPASQAYKTS